MKYDDEMCEVGALLRHEKAGRIAVLTAVAGPPLSSATVQYLEGDCERMGGVKLEEFERCEVRRGALLRECESGERVLLVEDSAGPNLHIQRLKNGKRERRRWCEKKGKRVVVSFEIAPAPPGTVVRETP